MSAMFGETKHPVSANDAVVAGGRWRGHFLGDGDIDVSFEFFPPKTAEMEQVLWAAVRRLAPLRPSAVAITYGAGGSTRDRTHATVARILSDTSLRPAAHLTCVSASREEVDAIARSYWELGVRHLVALRGDPPGGPSERFLQTPGGYRSALHLVKSLRALHPFEITVAVYPEPHARSQGLERDLDLLEQKIDAGATSAITQYFFESDHYFRFLERARARKIEIPIIPGVLPIEDFHRTATGAARRGVSIPRWLRDRFEGLERDPVTRRLIAAAVAAEHVTGLVERGVQRFHFFTLNRADVVYAACHALGLRPRR